jgi:hypothetical protein
MRALEAIAASRVALARRFGADPMAAIDAAALELLNAISAHVPAGSPGVTIDFLTAASGRVVTVVTGQIIDEYLRSVGVGPSGAFTRGSFVFCAVACGPDREAHDYILEHELHHVGQYELWGSAFGSGDLKRSAGLSVREAAWVKETFGEGEPHERCQNRYENPAYQSNAHMPSGTFERGSDENDPNCLRTNPYWRWEWYGDFHYI